MCWQQWCIGVSGSMIMAKIQSNADRNGGVDVDDDDDEHKNNDHLIIIW